MSVSDLERKLHRRHQELVRKLLQEHRDQRSPREVAGPVEGASSGTVEGAGTVKGATAGAVEGASGVECPGAAAAPVPHGNDRPATVQVPRPDCAPRGHDGLHPLEAALNLPLARYGVEVCRRTTSATAAPGPAVHAAAGHSSTRHRPPGRPRGGHAAPTEKSRILRRVLC